MAQSAVSAVVGSVSGLAVQETSLLCGLKDEVELLKEEVARLQSLLQDLHDKPRPGHATSTSVRQIKGAIEDAENVIEHCEYMEKRNRIYKGFMGAVTRYAVLPCDVITLHKVGVEVRRIRRKISDIKGDMQSISSIVRDDGVDMSHIEDVDDKFTPQSLQDDMIFVGFKEEYDQIVAKLLHGGDELSALSIVGMGGGGKTTIARKIFIGPEIKEHFDVTVWVSLPQKFSSTDILKHIYNQIVESSNNIGVHKVERKIYELLLQKRYLLVLDGVWEEDTWDKINIAFLLKDRWVKVFPNASNGSRVLLTTRNMFVATQTGYEMPTDLHALSLMDDEAALELLISSASQSFRRPKNSNEWAKFEKIGRELVGKCNGLPLALAVLGKYLAMNLDIQKWRDILEYWTTFTAITTEKMTGGKMMNDILGRSLNELPSQHLKFCFLYISAFPGNYVISVSDLIKLWIAEGLIPHNTDTVRKKKHVTMWINWLKEAWSKLLAREKLMEG